MGGDLVGRHHDAQKGQDGQRHHVVVDLDFGDGAGEGRGGASDEALGDEAADRQEEGDREERPGDLGEVVGECARHFAVRGGGWRGGVVQYCFDKKKGPSAGPYVKGALDVT